MAIVTFLSLGSVGLQNVYADIIISSDSGNYNGDMTAKGIRFYDQDQTELENIIIPSTEHAEYYLHINKGNLQNVQGMVIHDEDSSRPGLSVPYEDTFASIDDIADAINDSGFLLKIGKQEIASVRPGDKMTLTAGKNLTVVSNLNDNFTGGDGSNERVERGIQYNLADDISLNGITITPTKSTVGNNIRLDGNGLSLNSNNGSNTVYIRGDEINMGGHIIDNLHSGFVDPDGVGIGIENFDMEELAKRNDPMNVAENAANIGDLANVYTALDDKKLDADASNLTPDNVAKWQDKLGTGTVAANDKGLVTGDTVNTALENKADKTALDTKADKADLDAKANTDLTNVSDAGKTAIRDLAKESVKVVAGTNTTVTQGTEGNATTYSVSVSNDAIKGAVKTDLDAKADKTALDTKADKTELATKADANASNLTPDNVAKWQDKLGTGTVAANDKSLVTGGTVYSAMEGSVSYDSDKKDHITLKGHDGTIISNVKNGLIAPNSKDAVNGGQLYETNSRINQLGNDIKHVGATSAALAGLHPQDFDEHYKFTVAAARGSYDGASAYALGAFYRPNSDLMFNAASTISSGKNAYTVGVSYKFGTSTKKSVLAENEALQDKVNRLEVMLNDIMNKLSTNTNSSSDTNTMVRK